MITRILVILIASDFLLQAGWGLIGPIFALFLTEQIAGGTAVMVGFVVAAYWIVKSVIQPFLAHYLDTKKGERDDFSFLVIGMFVANTVPLGYLFVTEFWQVFLLEIIRGVAMAAVVPSWSAIFTRHIAKGWEAFSWSVESTALGFAAGFAAAFGGILATALGFQAVFLLVSCFGLLSSGLLFLARRRLFPSLASVKMEKKEKRSDKNINNAHYFI
ncbi:MAG: MFS transporter [Candidatus Wildermuthbacteria bacterium]|nr:MFS transporter [Candidatus Wildermuthbacteria bacterium]